MVLEEYLLFQIDVVSGVLVYDSVMFDTYLPNFQRNILPPSARVKYDAVERQDIS